ncbi:MAG: FAD-dependent thymidylate synthase [Alphaproteobacteria bacterium]|nr:MAG: FAD-dependent thymidylate synthase [Alphaproteobacteria bacterium]
MSLTVEHQSAIDAQRAEQNITRRLVAPELEAILYEAIPVLDHGFFRVVDYMGTDQSIVQAARISYGAGTKKVSEDRGLIRYLMRHSHTTPFEMCEIKLHIKLPIFIARQWIRHRTANVNEYSARYSILDKEFYLPAPEHLAAQSAMNNQGRGDLLQGAEAEQVLQCLKEDAQRCYGHYEEMLNEDMQGNIRDTSRKGLARELARMNLTLNHYTQWYWKTDLHNFLHFLRLRADSHSQYEIRVYAEKMLAIVKRWVPHTYEAFLDYKVGSYNLSAQAKKTLQRMLQGENINQENSGMPPREWREFVAQMNLIPDKTHEAA